MPIDPVKFADIVLSAFVTNQKTSDKLIGEAGGPSDTWMTYLRKVAEGEVPMRPLRSDSARRIDSAAGWRSGSALELWHTGELPPNHASRPAASDRVNIDRINARTGHDDDGAFHGVVESIATLPEGESRMEIHYWPGPGRAITSMDLGTAVAGAHRMAIEETYLQEARSGDVDSDAAQKKMNEAADRRRQEDYTQAARDGQPLSQLDPNQRKDVGEESQEDPRNE